MTNEDKIMVRNRIVKFIQSIQINSMIELIEKETKYVFNYRNKEERNINKAERTFPISFTRDKERRSIPIDQFITQENDGDLINEINKDYKRRIILQKAQRSSPGLQPGKGWLLKQPFGVTDEVAAF